MRFAFLFSLALVATVSAKADLISTFDSDLEEWTASGGTMEYRGSGGNPGGFLALTDNTDSYMTVYAPTTLLGDWSQYLGGSLSFDARNLNGASPDLPTIPLFGTVTIMGAGGTASRVLGGAGLPPADGLWHTYGAELDPTLWSGDLTGALSRVTQLSITFESNNIATAESNGFDNFGVRIATAVAPEPGSLVSAALGLAGLAGYLVRRKQFGLGKRLG